jgi:hypothetical protein
MIGLCNIPALSRPINIWMLNLLLKTQSDCSNRKKLKTKDVIFYLVRKDYCTNFQELTRLSSGAFSPRLFVVYQIFKMDNFLCFCTG